MVDGLSLRSAWPTDGTYSPFSKSKRVPFKKKSSWVSVTVGLATKEWSMPRTKCSPMKGVKSRLIKPFDDATRELMFEFMAAGTYELMSPITIGTMIHLNIQMKKLMKSAMRVPSTSMSRLSLSISSSKSLMLILRTSLPLVRC